MITTVQIETTNKCNANCIFCPRHCIAKFGTMSDWTLASIIDDVKQRHSNIKRICPQGTGEPFLDGQFLQRLEFMRDQIPEVHFSIFTNGSLMSDKTIEWLQDFGNLDITFSLNGSDAKTRKAMMGLNDFERVRDLYHNSIAHGIDTKVSIVAHPILGVKHLVDFMRYYGHQIIQFQSFGGLMYRYRRPDDAPDCVRKQRWLTYEWTGVKTKCCFDVEGQADCGQCTEGVQI